MALGLALPSGWAIAGPAYGQSLFVAPPPRFMVIAMPRAAAEQVLSSRSSALGIGVFPDSRDPLAFVREIGAGAPHGRGSAVELAGAPGRLGRALRASRQDVAVSSDGPRALRNALAVALASDPANPPFAEPQAALRARVAGFALRSSAEFEALDEQLKNFGGVQDAVVLGLAAQTPVLVGIVGGESRQTPGAGGFLLSGGLARRPAIVTPYDLAVTILARVGASKSNAFIGSELGLVPPTDPSHVSALPEVHQIEARFVRDARSGPALAQVATALALASIIGGLALWGLGRRDLAVRCGHAAWLVMVGYEAALFVSSGRAEIRVIPVIAALGIGLFFPRRDPRSYARLAFGMAMALAALEVIAALRPGGEPALSLWGNPLVSWRFFGLQNGEAAIVASGVVVWGTLAGLATPALALVSVAAALVIGAPHLGANFVGVLTFAFGAALVVFALERRRVEAWHLITSTAIAVGAFVVSLLADVGSPVSHGGIAARKISEGGLKTAWGFVRARLELNLHLIRGTAGGFLWVALVFVTAVLLARWGAKDWTRGGAVVWAGAMMSLSSLVLEDSGFYSGAVLLLPVAAAWMMWSFVNSPRDDLPAGAG